MGDQDSIYGFAALGLEPFSITNPQAAERKLKGSWRRGAATR